MAQNAQPNILVLHTDQQRFDTIHALGAEHMHTPNMDRLVAMGTSFLNAYSANPVCMPARHDLLTGCSARHHGYYHNANQSIADYALATVPRMLSEAGYQTMAVGKTHHNPEREHHGFDHLRLMAELPTCRANDDYLLYLESKGYGDVRCEHGVRPLFYHTPQVSRVPEEHHGSAWVATQTIALLDRPQKAPWYCFASWVGPHPPYYMPQRYLDMYHDQAIPAPCPPPEADERHAPISPENPDQESLEMQRLREAYYGATSLIDTHIGRILDMLERSGQLENTVIILTADHGEMLGDRGNYQKHVPYEGSAHIPMIVCGPGFEAGARVTTPTTTWDVAATMLDVANARVPVDHPLVGASLRSEACRDPYRIVVYHHATGSRRYLAAVGQGCKLIHWFNGGDEELYDLESDRFEKRNLIGAPDRQAVVAALRNACMLFERDHGIASNVRDQRLVDLPYDPAPEGYASLYPDWSSRQFPRWMDGYASEDMTAIAEQMRAVLATADVINIPRDSLWRHEAMEEWTSRGGDPAVYREIWAEVDRRAGD